MGDEAFQLIRQAILFENEELLIDLLTANPSHSWLRDASGRSPLMLAAHNGRLKALEICINLAPETMDAGSPSTGKTALQLCCEAGETAAASLLLTAGADPEIVDRQGYCALELAHIAGHSGIAALLIDAIQAEASRLEVLHASLQKAAEDGEVAEVEELLKAKGDKGKLLNGTKGKGVLFAACESGRAEVVSVLLDESLRNFHSLVDDQSGDTVLHAAVSSQNMLVVKRILEVYPTLVSRSNKEGSGVLHWAVRSGNVDIVELILDFPYPPYSLIDVEGHNGSYRFAFDVNAGDAECRTALYLAVMLNHSDILSSLLSMTLSMSDSSVRCPFLVDVYCSKGTTPLMLAAANKNLPIISMLLSNGADVNLPLALLDESETRAVGSGALLEAARAESIEVADLLLEKGALDTDNRALRMAVNKRSDGIIRLLLSRLAFPDGEYRVNKRNVELGQMQIGESLLPSSLCPSKPVMLHWSSASLDCVLSEWLASACLHINTRLKTSRLAFAAVTRVDLSSNRLSLFPPLLWQMPSLRVLNVASNLLTQVDPPSPSAFASTSIESLILRDNSLSALSSSLLSLLPSLSSLDISNNKIKSLPESIWLSPSLKELNASGNELSSLPSAHSGNSGRRMESETASIASQTAPTKKGRSLVRRNQWQEELGVSEVVDDEGGEMAMVASCSTMNTLNISNNKFRMFPTCLACTCPRLQSLSVAGNQLTTVCAITALPALLKNLDVSSNKLSQLFSPNAPMGECHAGVVNVGSGGRRSSPGRQSRSRSKSAVRSQRALSSTRGGGEGGMSGEVCPHRRHSALPYLKTLNVAGNKLPSLVLTRGDVLLTPSLSSLDASRNEIAELEGANLSKLTSLCVLSLSNNPLTHLPAELGLLSRLWSLSLKECPLKEPLASIVSSENAKTVEIIAHLRCILEESKTYAHLGLFVLGDSGVGKTTIADCIMAEGDKLKSVLTGKAARIFGVKLASRKNRPAVSFSVWDANGQPELRPLHEYAFCRRAVFVVVFRVSEGEAALSSIGSLLVAIHSRAPNACVVLVGTHVDQLSSARIHSPSLLNELELSVKSKFMVADADKHGLPRVIDLLFINAKAKSEVRSVLTAIVRAAEETKIGKETVLAQQVPSSHVALLKTLQELSIERRRLGRDPVVKESRVVEYTKDAMKKRLGRQLRDEVELRSAISFAKDAGSIVRMEGASLSSLIVLDPLWLVDTLSLVLTARGGARPAGLLPSTALAALKELSSIRPHTIALLHKCHVGVICHSHLLILPSLLPDEFALRADYATRVVELESKTIAPSSSPSRFSSHKPLSSTSHSLVSRPLSLARLYSMTYIPTGFWPRLIARLTSDDNVARVIGEMRGGGGRTRWILWQTGTELMCGRDRLVVVKEFMPQADPSEEDIHCLQWRAKVEGKWRGLSLSACHSVLVCVPSTDKAVREEKRITTKMIALVVDIIDTLLEDWFPSIGTRFVHSSQGDLLVNRLVPCPFCSPLSPLSHENGRARDDSDLERARHVSERLRSKTMDGIADSSVVHAFGVEECMEAARREGAQMECPLHGPLPVPSLTSDVSFYDVDPSLLLHNDQLKRGRLVGRGAFGFVFRAHLKQTATAQLQEVAVKMLEPVEPGQNARMSALNEYRVALGKWERDTVEYATRAYLSCRQELCLIGRLCHPNALSLIGLCIHPLSLVVEMAPQGSLRQLLAGYRKSGARLSLCTMEESAVQIAKALEYLHANNIIYRDLKSENVLAWRFPSPFCLGEVHLKLGDYGISRVVQPSGGLKGFGGTEGFMAPEMVKWNGEEEYTLKVDVFSYGMFLYELLTLKLPFESEEHVKERLLEGARPLLMPSELLWPSSVLDLLAACWKASPVDRPSSSQLVTFCSAPEFTHLLDAIVIPSAPTAVVTVTMSDVEEDNDDAQVWMATSKGIDVYSCTAFGWVECTSLCLDSHPRLLSRDRSPDWIWCLSINGDVRLLSTSLVESSSSIPFPSLNSHAMLSPPLALSPSLLFTSSTFSLHLLSPSPDDLFSPPRIVESLTSPFEILAVAFLNQTGNRQIWTGHGEGLITAHFISADDRFSFSSSLSHPEGNSLPVKNLIASKDGSTVWSSLVGSSRVFCWDGTKRKMKNSLDTKKVLPASETIHTMEMDTCSHVCSLCLLDRGPSSSLLFVGTVEGSLLVLSAHSLHPLSACRPYHAALDTLLLVDCRGEEDTQPGSTRTSSEGAFGWMKERVERLRASPSVAFNHNNYLLMSIGRGFRTLTDRLIVGREPQDDVVAALWRIEDWSSM